MDTVERSAKTKDLAIAEALSILGVAEAGVNIVVLDEGSKGGLFGIGAKPARVRVSLKPDPEGIIKNFLREVILSMGLSVNLEVNRKDKRVYVNLVGDNMGILIGKRGQTLDSLQYLTNLVLNGYGFSEVSVVLDTGNYRKRRKDTLESLARNIARKVRTKGYSVKLEPMSRFERHIIHTTLQNDKSVRTYSEGNEPHRYVVVGTQKS